jgi:hypothetical protein
MWKTAGTLIGTILFIFGIGLAIILGAARLRAGGHDENVPIRGPVDSEPPTCAPFIEPDVTLEQRLMSVQDSQALTVALANTGEIACDVTVALNAPNFAVSPPETQRTVRVWPGTETKLNWVLSPHQLGTFSVAISVGSVQSVLGITVTNVLGLTARQAALLSALATFLGPILSAPWWVEQWQKWRKQKAEQAAAGEEEYRRRGPFE